MSLDKTKKISKRLSINDIRNLKNVRPIVSLTAYSFSIAKILDEYVDIILVGDSLAMVLYGMENTLNLSVDTMIAHGKAVVRGAKRSLIVVDMPFASYQVSKEQAFINASRILAETSCSAIKMEGGKEMSETIRYLTERGVPVVSHIGLKPQYINIHGGYNVIGKDDLERKILLEDAKAVEQSGAVALVVESVKEDIAAKITKSANIPVIGIGASVLCDGQVLVLDDMLGVFREFTPKFVKKYESIGEKISEAVKNFSEDVKNKKFPEIDKHCFK